MSTLKCWIMLFILPVLILTTEGSIPYEVDSHTLHLYHFDGNGLDEVTNNPVNLNMLDGAIAVDDSISEYGQALNTYDGVSGDGPIAGAAYPDILTVGDFVGADGAFTFEAVIKPNVPLEALPNHMQIICGEGDGLRGWQFRINTNGQLQFYNLTHINSVGWDSVASVPISGEQAYEAGVWYHVAVTYDGFENTADNLKFYWTRMDSGVSEAQLLASFTMEFDLSSGNPAKFSVGNEYRQANYSENFEGWIDEVRISDIMRAPSEMIRRFDPNTLHYYRLDGDGVDLIRTNPVDLILGNGASFTETGVSEYGIALNTYEGNDGEGPYAAAEGNPIELSDFVGNDGAFTFEAFIRPDVALEAVSNHMQIISIDSNNTNSSRGFHFRINDSGQLQFTKITGVMEDFTVEIPTSGNDAYATGTWYHVAVTYTGQENAAENLKLYWTKLNGSSAQAQLLESFMMAEDLDTSVMSNFGIGNELRPTGGFTENFEGLIDEVRISNIAREASDLLYELNDELPLILEQPANQIVKANETAVFTTIFTSATLPQVTWYKLDKTNEIEFSNLNSGITTDLIYDPDTQIFTSVLTIENSAVSDSGQYFARITNVSEKAVDTDTVMLGVKGLRAHWTLNLSDFTGTHYLDSIGDNDALVALTPTFVPGADGTENGAVRITIDSGWSTLSEFDPARFTGQFTISYWINWRQQDVESDDLLIDSGDVTAITIEDALMPDQQWHHICAAFDGSLCRLYLDGLLEAESEWQLPQDLTCSLSIGSAEDGIESFNGNLDDIRVYSYALDDYEVAQLRYNFAGLRSCLLTYSSQCDWSGPDGNSDCSVDIYDLAAFAIAYLSTDSTYDLTGPADIPDGQVNLLDFEEVCFGWMDNGLYPYEN